MLLLTMTMVAVQPFSRKEASSLWGEHWYPVGIAATQPKSPTSQCLLGAQIVVFHDGSKWCTALDRCPHRFARLSEGCVVAGNIECPYHGWRFDGGDGSLVSLPQLEEGENQDDDASSSATTTAAASRCSVLTLPTKVSHGLIFALAAPLFGIAPSSPEPRGDAVEEEEEEAPLLRQVFREGGDFVWTDYSRDLPMDATTLLENVLDPSHLPFTHDGTISRRSAAGPVRFGPVERFSRKGFRVQRGEHGSSVNFFAPNLVISETMRPNSFRDLNVVYAVPQQPGKCRLYVRVVFEVEKMPNALARFAIGKVFSGPPWISHVTNHRVLEDDNVFLHFAERELRDNHPSLLAPDWNQRLFLPTSADKTVIAFRKWIDKYTNGTGAALVGGSSSSETTAALCSDQSLTRRSLTDRLLTHTEICSSCTKARRIFIKITTAAYVSSYLSLAAAAALDRYKVALALFSSCLFLVASTIKANIIPAFEHGSYPPPRNTPARLKPWRRKLETATR